MLDRNTFDTWISQFSHTIENDNYYLHLSNHVAVLYNFKGFKLYPNRLNLKNTYLYSLTHRKVINSKDAPASGANPEEILKHWVSIYQDKINFYEKQLHMTDEEKMQYQIQMSMKIQSKPSWDQSTFLKDCLEKVNKGQVLSAKTEQAIDKPVSSSPSVLSDQQIAFQKRIDALCQASKTKGDEWTASFSQSILDAIAKYGSKTTLTERQKQILQDKFTKYSI
jgi:hypothetical protein